MSVLGIGRCGLIGSCIVDRLLVQGLEFRVFDRQAEKFRVPFDRVEL